MRCLWTCEPGWEDALVAELGGTAAGSPVAIAPGWIESRSSEPVEPSTPLCVALATQCLPAAIELVAPSISIWARQCGEWLIERLRDHPGPWRFHLFSHYPPGDISGRRRCELIDAALREFLRRKQRRLLRNLIADPAAPWQEHETLIQLGLREATRGAISCCPADLRHRLRRVVSRFPGGELPPADEPDAPSRAYRKLDEVQRRLDRPIASGEHCVDLGSSPGSWAWLALRNGAQVTAVDRSPLRADLMHNARLHFVRGDVFKYVPEAAVDWLLCDVIAFPRRSLELLATWLRNRWCRQFCVTIKFRGQDDYGRLAECKQILDAAGAEYWLRRLSSNRNEVTAYGFAEAALAHATVGRGQPQRRPMS